VPWVIRDVVNDINKAAGKRWHALDPLLPEPGDLPEACMAPLVATGANGRPAGLAVCVHRHVPANSLQQAWGPVNHYVLTARLRGPDLLPAMDELLTGWREHLAGIPEAADGDTAAMITWPSRDVTAVRALVRHGMAPMTVIAARPAGRALPPGPDAPADLVIRRAGPDDLDIVTEFELGVIKWDGQFDVGFVRPATEGLVRQDTAASLSRPAPWTWLAERGGQPVGMVVLQPPEQSAWIAGMTSAPGAAYLATMFVRPDERSGGVGAALVKRAHDELDAQGVAVTLLHYAQVNPVSVPFWSRMGYRPLWTAWDTRPAATLR
jgi:GNAT superfamily N-acetyltransferase